MPENRRNCRRRPESDTGSAAVPVRSMMDPEKPKEEERNGEEPGEEYHFLRETVKRPAFDLGAFARKALTAAVLGVIFGVCAALVFHSVKPGKDSDGPKQVTIAPDSRSVSSAPPQEESGGTDSSTASSEPESRTESVPESGEDREKTEEELLRERLEEYRSLNAAMEAAAEIPSKSVVTVYGMTEEDDWFRIDEEGAFVSGVIVADNEQSLLILTTYGAIRDADEIRIVFADGTRAAGTLLSRDPSTGLAVVQVEKDLLTEETLDASPVAELGNSFILRKGEPVIAIGSPTGEKSSMVYGEVTSLGRLLSLTDCEYSLISTNMMGSSGGSGVLINLNGQVVGILCPDVSDQTVIRGIPISPVKSLIERLSNNRPISYLGVRGQDVTREVSESTGIPQGVYVTAVDTDSPAFSAGIQNGDVITFFGESEVAALEMLHTRLLGLEPGEVIPVKVMRRGAEGYVEFEFSVTLGSAQ